MVDRYLSKLREHMVSIFVILIICLVWELISSWRKIYLMPTLSSILSKLFEMVITGQLTEHIIVSLSRSLLGYLIATTVAIPLGVIIGWRSRAYRILEPIIDLFRTIPPVALIPLFILWLGIGEEPKIFIISLACFWPIFMNTLYGVRGVDDYLIKTAKSMSAKEMEIVLKVATPAASPYIFGGLRISLGTSFILLVTSEMLAANRGLGYLILYFEETFHIREMYATIIILTLVAYLFTQVLLILEDHFVGWHKAISIMKR